VSKFLSHDVPRGTAGWVAAEEAMSAVIQQLARGPYLLGDRFSAADTLFGTTFAMFGHSPLMAKSPVIDAYARRVVSRAACRRAQARESGWGMRRGAGPTLLLSCSGRRNDLDAEPRRSLAHYRYVAMHRRMAW
jgi:hypothetical protein